MSMPIVALDRESRKNTDNSVMASGSGPESLR
jgi:hypothetical protein